MHLAATAKNLRKMIQVPAQAGLAARKAQR